MPNSITINNVMFTEDDLLEIFDNVEKRGNAVVTCCEVIDDLKEKNEELRDMLEFTLNVLYADIETNRHSLATASDKTINEAKKLTKRWYQYSRWIGKHEVCH